MSLLNFLGPQFDESGKPLGPIEFERIAKERYFISRRLNTSYIDTGQITVLERNLLLKFISEEIAEEEKLLNEARENAKKR